MIRVQSGLLLLGVALVAPTIISVDAYGQLTSEVLQQQAPLPQPRLLKIEPALCDCTLHGVAGGVGALGQAVDQKADSAAIGEL